MPKKNVVNKEEKLLKFIGTIVVPAIGRFIAADNFWVPDSLSVAKIWRVGEYFKECFYLKLEKPVAEGSLKCAQLLRPAHQGRILEEFDRELGDKDKAAVTLAQIYHLIERQTAGTDKVLLVKAGLPNVFYVRDVDGILRCIGAIWHKEHGWEFVFFGTIRCCPEGSFIFYRNS